MNKLHKTCIAALIAMAAVTINGCQREDTDRLTKIGRILSDRAEKAMGELEKDFSDEWKNIKGRGEKRLLIRRVSTRLNSEKSLTSVRIEVNANDDAIILKGKVNSMEQRRRAVDLAESTQGVTKVNDQLEVVAQ